MNTMEGESSSSPRVVVAESDVARPNTAAVAATNPSIPHLTYHGGPVLGAVEVVPIYWGAAWTQHDDAALAAELDPFFDYILTSSLLDMLGEYSTPTTRIQHGRRLPSVHLSSSEPGSMTPAGRLITDEQVQQALRGWIGDNTVPVPTANTLYFIFLPRGVGSLGFYLQSCVAGTFYGYHAHIKNVYYVVVPYIDCRASIFSGAPLDTFTAVSSRELCAAITDPALDGWWDPANDEIGDVCNHETVRLGGYLIQVAWSNTQERCAFQAAASAADNRQAEDRSTATAQEPSRVSAAIKRKPRRLAGVL